MHRPLLGSAVKQCKQCCSRKAAAFSSARLKCNPHWLPLTPLQVLSEPLWVGRNAV